MVCLIEQPMAGRGADPFRTDGFADRVGVLRMPVLPSEQQSLLPRALRLLLDRCDTLHGDRRAEVVGLSRFSSPIKRIKPPQFDRAEAAAELIRLLDKAPPMPLLRDRVRVDREDAEALIELIIRAPAGETDPLTRAAVGVRNALKDAPTVPFTYQVRISPYQAQQLATALRSAPEPSA